MRGAPNSRTSSGRSGLMSTMLDPVSVCRALTRYPRRSVSATSKRNQRKRGRNLTSPFSFRLRSFYAFPISIPEAKTSDPPKTTCSADIRKLILKYR